MSKFLTGAALGLVAGLLLAPEKGSETRENIASTASRLKHKWDRIRGKAGIELADLSSIFESEIAGLSDDVRARILTIIEESKASAQRVRNEVSNGML